MEMLLPADRRVMRRMVSTDCQVVRERTFSLVGEVALDLSPEGMFLRTDRTADIGEALMVALRVPGTDTWVDATAIVARRVAGRRRGDRGAGLGLRFSDLSPEDDRALRNALRAIPPTFPARAPRVDYAATAAFIALA